MSKRKKLSENAILMQQWDFEKNDLNPYMLTQGSQKKAWWKCSHGHSWLSRVENRCKGSGCPYCAGHRAIAGINDLQTLNPQLAEEWDFEKNQSRPMEFTAHSHVKVWWKCGKGHSWEARIFNRSNGDSCPYCVGKKVLTGINDLQTLNPALVSEWDYDKNVLLPSQVAGGIS